MTEIGIHTFVPHYTVAEREAVGRTARQRVPRKRQGQWLAPADRPDPIELLLGQEVSRVPGLLPLRHERMGASAFAFYRGTAIIMASDLASQPDSGLTVHLCGDAHLSNFGLYAAPDRVPVFDLNDFDDTHPGPFEWDVKRLAASFVLAARDSSYGDVIARSAARDAAAQYRQSMAQYAGMNEIDIWYDRIDASSMEQWARTNTKQFNLKAMQKSFDRAQQRTMWTAVSKLTTYVDGHRRFLDQPPVLVRVPEDTMARTMMMEALDQYFDSLAPDRRAVLQRYEVVDFGHKVVGVGSVGLVAWVLLLEGRDDSDVLVLQIKQAQKSVLEPYTDVADYSNQGQRVVEGQRIIQAASDPFLGWLTGKLGREYYVRQLRDMKWSPEPSALLPQGLINYARLCGHVLARAHARSGDAVAISSYMGESTNFEAAIADFSLIYADLVAHDFELFQEAVASGRLIGGSASEQMDDYLEAFRNPAAYPVQ
ncbi:MAG: DUF2252 domain-containing protein [Actinomycetota bacterium]